MTGLSEREKSALETLRRYRDDFELFAENNLKIRDKNGRFVPFVLNAAQRFVHDTVENQRAETGKVRALILKGRQQGVSTYTEGRFYWKASLNRGVSAFIMAHEQSASDTLFDMVDRFQRNNPLRPHTGVSNAKELVFDKLDSSYTVSTAGQKAGGRSKTITLYHGSEAAFWQNAADHFAASIQTVPDAYGTEIILESTANGASGEFYERWQDAEAGKGDYIPVFVPWFWQPEYSRPDLVDETFELSAEAEEGDVSEEEYAWLYGLSYAQMAWRRQKIAELRSARLFKQEYPATPAEAFQSTQDSPFIDAVSVLRARKREAEGAGPLIIGVDPAGPGGDRFSVAWRRGLCCEKIAWRDKIEAPDADAWLASIIDEYDPARMFIDAGGIGASTVSLLKARGPKYADRVVAVNFGSPSETKRARPKMPGPKNRRAEMWDRMREWLLLEEGVSIPDLDVLQADLTAPGVKATHNNDLLLESKEDMRKRKVRSPDLADALALTFATMRHIAEYSEKPKPLHIGSPDLVEQAPARVYGSIDHGRHGWMR